MKREYSKPAMEVEVFEASEYVAACYKINCNVPGTGDLYAETNGKAGLQTGYGGDKRLVSNVRACNEWHKGVIRDSDPTPNGYWKYSSGWGSKTVDVFYWEEDLGSTYDVHATVMDKIQWETNPNAS